MRIGADYYPEHWKEERWIEDAKLMQDAGIEVIRVGEFSWSLYEPEEGKLQFEWLDKAINFFGEKGISVVIGTPSATPPKWLIDKHPDILPIDELGRVKEFGTRKHYCFSNDIYRSKTRDLVRSIAKHYKDNPYVEGWQIDNELGHSDTTRCYCDNCRSKFIKWLENKYGDIDILNETYGTVFWSQHYNAFSQIVIPKAGVCYDFDEGTRGQNPSLLLDYYNFCSDSIISFTKESVEAIREFSKLPCSSNLLDAAVNSETGIDYFELSKELDYVTWDNYIEFQWGRAKTETVSRDHALIRSYKKQPFWVMEQQSGPCGWSRMGSAPKPGELRLWTYQAVANGADTVVYFRWRACTFGTEQYWHGILGHDGKPNRRFEEIKRVGTEMKDISKQVGTLIPKAKVAIVKSFLTEWCHTIFPNVEDFQYDKLLLSFYKPFYDMGISVDFIDDTECMSSYSIVIVPALAHVSDTVVENMTGYTKNGGILLTSFRSGFRSEYNTALEDTIPGPLRELTGIEVPEYDPQFQKETNVSGIFGYGSAKLWCDIVTNIDAQELAVYTSGHYKGTPCLTVKNNTYYLACDLDDKAMNELAKYLINQTDIEQGNTQFDNVEIVHTTDGEKDVRFVLNHNEYEVIVPLDIIGKNLFTGEEVKDHIKVGAYDLAMIMHE
ncbi:MAG: beta-galactosidase [Suipraeoptans sp.]